MRISRFRAFAVGAWLALVVVAMTPSPAAAATPLPPPGTPVLSQVTTTSATFSWAASSGPVVSYTIQVIDEPLGVFHNVATVNATSYTHTGLTPDKVYIYRVVANARPGSGYSVSGQSGALYVTTSPLPDTIAPTKPGVPTAYRVSTLAATINFAASTDNNRVAGYWVQRQLDGVWTDVATNNITTVYLTGLTPATSYQVAVVAFDPNGNRSPRSDPLTFTTRQLQPQPTCGTQLVTFGQQYMLNVSVENMTAATVLDNWAVTFTLPAVHVVNSVFGASLSRTADTATVTPPVYSAHIGPGGSASFGFIATYPVGSTLPTGFVLNGAIPCA